MRRAELITTVLALGAAGCMRIYPDPELPDATIEWFDGACTSGTDVTLTLDGIDDTTVHYSTSATCEATKATVKDVARQRYHITAQLIDDMGQAANAGESEIDLRNGLDETAYVDLGGFENFRVAWTFANGESCASLGLEAIDVELLQGGLAQLGYGAACDDGVHADTAPPGTYAVKLVGFVGDVQTVASAPTAEMTVGFGPTADFGTVEISPCSGPCP